MASCALTSKALKDIEEF
ncbi:hypothetical protein TNCT_649981, partial [Trichonephila clavata]